MFDHQRVPHVTSRSWTGISCPNHGWQNFDMPKLFWNIEFVCNNGISEINYILWFSDGLWCFVFLPILSLHLADFVSFHDYTRCFNWLWHWPSVTSLFSIYPQVQKMRQTQTPLCCDRTCYEVSEALRLCARPPREIHFCSGGCAHVCFLNC